MERPSVVSRLLKVFSTRRGENRPPDNSLAWWKQYVNEFFSPTAVIRLSVSSVKVFQNWVPVPLTVPAHALPRLFQFKHEHGVVEELLMLGDVTETWAENGAVVLMSGQCQEHVIFDSFTIIQYGKLRAVFDAAMKLQLYDFEVTGFDLHLDHSVIHSDLQRMCQALNSRSLLLSNLVTGVSAAAGAAGAQGGVGAGAPGGSSAQDACVLLREAQALMQQTSAALRAYGNRLEGYLSSEWNYIRRILQHMQMADAVNTMMADLTDLKAAQRTGLHGPASSGPAPGLGLGLSRGAVPGGGADGAGAAAGWGDGSRPASGPASGPASADSALAGRLPRVLQVGMLPLQDPKQHNGGIFLSQQQQQLQLQQVQQQAQQQAQQVAAMLQHPGAALAPTGSVTGGVAATSAGINPAAVLLGLDLPVLSGLGSGGAVGPRSGSASALSGSTQTGLAVGATAAAGASTAMLVQAQIQQQQQPMQPQGPTLDAQLQLRQLQQHLQQQQQHAQLNPALQLQQQQQQFAQAGSAMSLAAGSVGLETYAAGALPTVHGGLTGNVTGMIGASNGGNGGAGGGSGVSGLGEIQMGVGGFGGTAGVSSWEQSVFMNINHNNNNSDGSGTLPIGAVQGGLLATGADGTSHAVGSVQSAGTSVAGFASAVEEASRGPGHAVDMAVDAGAGPNSNSGLLVGPGLPGLPSMPTVGAPGRTGTPPPLQAGPSGMAHGLGRLGCLPPEGSLMMVGGGTGLGSGGGLQGMGNISPIGGGVQGVGGISPGSGGTGGGATPMGMILAGQASGGGVGLTMSEAQGSPDVGANPFAAQQHAQQTQQQQQQQQLGGPFGSSVGGRLLGPS